MPSNRCTYFSYLTCDIEIDQPLWTVLLKSTINSREWNPEPDAKYVKQQKHIQNDHIVWSWFLKRALEICLTSNNYYFVHHVYFIIIKVYWAWRIYMLVFMKIALRRSKWLFIMADSQSSKFLLKVYEIGINNGTH